MQARRAGMQEGCGHAVPGCRQDACQDTSALCKATFPLCPGQPGKEPVVCSVPTPGEEAAHGWWHKDRVSWA